MLPFARRRRSRDRYLVDTRTMFGRTRIYDIRSDGDDVMRVLDIEGTWQSACYQGPRAGDLVFRYHRRIAELIALWGRPQATALMLGGGGFALPSWLACHDPSARVDAVEIDPDIIALARRWLSLSQLDQEQSARLGVFCADACDFLEHPPALAACPYDLVLNDLFAATRPERGLMDAAGLALVKHLLANDGLYLANVVSALEGSRSRPLRRVRAALDETFAHVLVLPLGADEPRTPDNNIVIASDAELTWLG